MSTTMQIPAGSTRQAAPPDAASATAARTAAETRTATGTEASAAPAESAGTTAPTSTSALATPKPLRFPWLSRLSQQLEPAAKQKSTFPAAPVLGDNVDKQA